MASPRARKAVVVTFGGGARDEETFMPDGQENIPHLLTALMPRATFFSQIVNRGILGHYVATASLATGAYETFNNFAAVPPDHPTVFEYFRRDLKRPAADAWVVAPSNGFNRIGESGSRAYGRGWGAGVILPKRLLAAALSSSEGPAYEHLLRDNYETSLYAPDLGGNQVELHQMAEVLRLSVADFSAHARVLASPDELSVYIARHLMRQLAPSLLWITLHDIDIAHSGTYRFISRPSNAPTASAGRSGTIFRASRNTRAKPPCLSCPISAAIPTTTRVATDSSITVPAIRFPALPG
jgi:hypothetical protein